MIDAHQHFWRYDPAEYEWIDERLATLRRNYLPLELLENARAVGVTGTIAVQARQSLEETSWLLKLADEFDFIGGIVGWAPIADPIFPQLVDSLREDRKLKGLRHVLQAEPDGFLSGAGFNAGIGALEPTGLVYDILILERQLPEAIVFVDRHPNQIFVLDHIAKPRIAENILSPWAENIEELAKRQNVYVKLSGMVTEADWNNWTALTLRPYFDVVLRSFSPRRLMAGSDWPVCTVASSYSKWFDTLRFLTSDLSSAEQERIFSGTATEAYRLKEL